MEEGGEGKCLRSGLRGALGGGGYGEYSEAGGEGGIERRGIMGVFGDRG